MFLVLGTVLGDPAIESGQDRGLFIQQVEKLAGRVPVIYAFQILDVLRGFLMVAAGLGLYLILRKRAQALGLGGLLMVLMSGVFAAITAIVGATMTRAAEDYAGRGLEDLATGSDELLQGIRVLTALHWGSFLTGMVALGFGIAVFSYGLTWLVGWAPRWQG